MSARTLTLVVSLAACLALAVARAPVGRACDGDEPPGGAAPDKAKKDDIVEFGSIAEAAKKALVLDFRESDKLDRPDCPRWGYTPDSKVAQIGEYDRRSAVEHFKDFDHPRVQPRPDDPSWRTYMEVPNRDSEQPRRHAIPKACRPEDENWLNLKKGEAPPEGCQRAPTGKFRFESLPLIQPSETIRVTYVRTPDGIFPPLDPFSHPPGTNMLPTVYSEVFDGENHLVPNSLPSSVERRYNLHEGEPAVSPTNPRSPTNDLQEVLDSVYTLLTGKSPKRLWEGLDRERYEDTLRDLSGNAERIKANRPRIRHYLEMAIAIIEGGEVPDRAYSGFPLLHHSGHRRVRRVVPELGNAAVRPAPPVGTPADDAQPVPAIALEANVVCGHARVHQVWFAGRIESDTMFLDWQGEYDGCRLLLLKTKADAEFPAKGRDLIAVAEIEGKLHFRLFDHGGKRVVDAVEGDSRLKARGPLIRALRGALDKQKLWDVNPQKREQRYEVTRDVLPIVGTSPADHCLEDGCPVQLQPDLDDSGKIRGEGKDLLILALVKDVLHIRFFDDDGKMAVDTDERHLVARAGLVSELKRLLKPLWGLPTLTEQQRHDVVQAALPIMATSPLDHCLDDLNVPPIPPKVPWTITYTIDVLDHGADDFATTTMFFDTHNATEAFMKKKEEATKDRGKARRQQFQTRIQGAPPKGVEEKDAAPKMHPQLPLVSMDQTFFPMRSGTRTVLTVKMPPPEYHNLTYTWGWRFHPPRAQAMEDAAKRKFGEGAQPSLVEYEREVFGEEPSKAIDRLGDLAPAKRMWRSFRHVLAALEGGRNEEGLTQLLDARNAFLDWKDRVHLPSGLQPDPDSDLTVLFANNTTYGHLRSGGWVEMPDWRTRGRAVKVTLINADYFPHQYLNVEWGGNRGWEPQFKPTLPLAGSGTFFSFGRFHYQFNTPPGKIEVPAAVRKRKDGTCIQPTDPDAGDVPAVIMPGVHRLWINMNHEPSRRLRFYQFDPTHHDVAIYSIH